MIVFIRVDSGEAIGTGHVMRCITLANRLAQNINKHDIIFLSKPHRKNIISKIEESGFKILTLSQPEYEATQDDKSWLGTSVDNDADEVISFISQYDDKEKVLIIDHYSIDVFWERKLRDYVKKIIVIDDLANRKHDCDVLLDQNFYRDKEKRYDHLVPQNTKLLLGPQYALLRDEFYQYCKDYKFSPTIKNLLVYFGGIDSAGMTLKTAKLLVDYPDIMSHIVISPLCPDYNTIQELCSGYESFKLYDHVSNMAYMMASCDAAIGAGGTTQWERIVIGIPSLVFSIADNQIKACEDLFQKKIIMYAKDDIAKNIEQFISRSIFRKTLYKNSKSLMSHKELGVDYIISSIEHV